MASRRRGRTGETPGVVVGEQSREADHVSAMGKDAGKKRDVTDADGIGCGEDDQANKQGRACSLLE
jgi:hypothetical protein